jgi:hypothetical protein
VRSGSTAFSATDHEESTLIFGGRHMYWSMIVSKSFRATRTESTDRVLIGNVILNLPPRLPSVSHHARTYEASNSPPSSRITVRMMPR